MNIKSGLCFALFAITLTACGFSQFERSSVFQDINVDSAFIYPIQKGYPNSSVTFISIDGGNKAAFAKLFVGNKNFQANYSDNPYWRVTIDACKDLPQGKNIPVRFEQYDAAGQVLVSQRIILSSVDAC